VKSSTIYSLLLCSFSVSANPSSLQEPIQEIEVITVEGQQLYLKKREIEHAKGFSNADIFSTFASIDANNLRNEAGALDIGIRGVQGEGRVPIFIDGSLQSTHTNRGIWVLLTAPTLIQISSVQCTSAKEPVSVQRLSQPVRLVVP
tara:strand:- start:640 stop:1077 length:438 start_codon:yes stop_codon:yes gene_type:complete